MKTQFEQYTEYVHSQSEKRQKYIEESEDGKKGLAILNEGMKVFLKIEPWWSKSMEEGYRLYYKASNEWVKSQKHG